MFFLPRRKKPADCSLSLIIADRIPLFYFYPLIQRQKIFSRLPIIIQFDYNLVWLHFCFMNTKVPFFVFLLSCCSGCACFV